MLKKVGPAVQVLALLAIFGLALWPLATLLYDSFPSPFFFALGFTAMGVWAGHLFRREHGTGWTLFGYFTAWLALLGLAYYYWLQR